VSFDWTTMDVDRAGLHAALSDDVDDAIVTNWATEFTDDPYMTPAETLDDLRILVAELNSRCQGQIDPGYIEEEIGHEDEHAAAARAVGFSKVRYGLMVRRYQRNTPEGGVEVLTRWRVLIQHVAPVGPISKLAYATVVAAPSRLSDADAAALRDMGYRDAGDAAARVRTLAARTGRRLPVPRSAVISSAVDFPEGPTLTVARRTISTPRRPSRLSTGLTPGGRQSREPRR
jgi:hypothetical protein